MVGVEPTHEFESRRLRQSTSPGWLMEIWYTFLPQKQGLSRFESELGNQSRVHGREV